MEAMMEGHPTHIRKILSFNYHQISLNTHINSSSAVLKLTYIPDWRGPDLVQVFCQFVETSSVARLSSPFLKYFNHIRQGNISSKHKSTSGTL